MHLSIGASYLMCGVMWTDVCDVCDNMTMYPCVRQGQVSSAAAGWSAQVNLSLSVQQCEASLHIPV